MTRKTVRTQRELDTALADPDIDHIIIDSDHGVWLHVGAGEQPLQGSASVEARDSAHVAAWGSARVVARGSASVEAWDSASVEAWDSARVVAGDSASVVAWDSVSVEAGSHTAVHLHSGRATVSGGVVIDHTTVDLSDRDQWCAYHAVRVEDGHVVAYKAVRDDYRSAHGTLYTPGTTATCDDWADTDECGGGLHFSPSPAQARNYDAQATRFVEVRVPLGEIRPITGGGAAKAKARSVVCVREVDRWGDAVVEVAAALNNETEN